MIGVVARKEFTGIIRDGRFKYTAIIMLLLLLTAFMTGWQRYTNFTDMRTAAQGSTNAQWLKQGDKNPHSAAHYGNYAFKPAGPLSFFDNGVENYTGTAVFMEAHKQNFAFARPAADASAITRFGDLTGATILQVLLPLFIIFLGFTAFSGEREQGTLRQLMSMGVSRSTLLWGKALGIGSAIVMIVLPCIIAGALLLSLVDLGNGGADFWARIGWLGLTYAAYGGVFLFVTLGVSALTRTAHTTLIILVGFWVFTAFLTPKIAAELSKNVYPAPSFGEFQAAMRTHQARGFDGVPPYVRLREKKAELYKKYNVSAVKDLPIYWPATRMQTLEELDHHVFDKHYNDLRTAYKDQRRFQDLFGMIAPTLSIKSISRAVSGSDLMTHVKFMEDAEIYRRNMVVKMNGYLSKAAASLNASYSSSNFMVADEEVFAIVPPFIYERPSLSDMLDEHKKNLIIIFLWFLCAIGFARLAAGRLSMEES